MKLLIIVGARPNFIKVAPLIEEIKRHNRLTKSSSNLVTKSLNNQITYTLVHTGQHYDYEMSQIFFQDLKIPKPDYNLGVGLAPYHAKGFGVGSSSHAWQTAKIMERLEPVILRERPNLVIVVGDVNSTLAGALVSAKLHIPVVHIEAGLRSFDKTMPEEINRVLTDHISDILFCPTKTAVENLKKEGIGRKLPIIINVGDIMYDTFLKGIKIAEKKSKILNKLKLKPKEYFLLTLHRPNNVDNPERLKKILEAINESGKKIIFPVHPRTKAQLSKLFKQVKQLKSLNKLNKLKNLLLIRPVGYLDMLYLEKNAKKILTDSGGVQKEAYFAKVPCITLRDRTEWVETVDDSWNILVDTNKNKILKAIKKFNPRRQQHKYFGNGKTAKEIVEIINHYSLKGHFKCI